MLITDLNDYRTARSRSSGGYLLDEPPDMTPCFPTKGVSGHAGAVQSAALDANLLLTVGGLLEDSH
jgi:hypothetical protein